MHKDFGSNDIVDCMKICNCGFEFQNTIYILPAYLLNYCAYGLHSFLILNLFLCTRTVLAFLTFIFIFCKSTFSCVFCMIITIEKGC